MNFLFESFLHALVDAILVGVGLKVWGVSQAEPRQRFMSLVVVLPGVTPTLWRILGVEWGWVKSYHGVLSRGEVWLRVELFGIPLFRWSFYALMGFSVALFLFQELLPILGHLKQAKFLKRNLEGHGVQKLSLKNLGISPLGEFEGLSVYVVPDHWAIISSLYGNPPCIFIEECVLEWLNNEELRAAVAHEMAHLGIGRRPFMLFLYGFRILGFLNPIVLGGFRYILHEEECVCDDRAIWMTSVKPSALASALQKLYAPSDESGRNERKLIEAWSYPNLEAVGLNEQLNKRIQRLNLKTYAPNGPKYWPEMLIVTIGCLTLSFLLSG
jgi:Zn-dependent protease with chaperone function